jgi:hypothetical protein
MSWEDSEFDFKSVLECDECPKPNFDDEDETVKKTIVKPKTVIIKDPELIVCDDPEYATIYCSYEIAGRGRTAKTVISSILYNNQKILVSQDSKYIGDGVSIKQQILLFLKRNTLIQLIGIVKSMKSSLKEF